MKLVFAILFLIISGSKSFCATIQATGKLTSVTQQTLYWNDNGNYLFFKIQHPQGQIFLVYFQHFGDATKTITSMLLTAKSTGSDVSAFYDNNNDLVKSFNGESYSLLRYVSLDN